MWPFKSRKSAEPCPPVGQYRLGATIDDVERMTHLSPFEVAQLNPEITFEGEEIWNCPDSQFVGLNWRTIIGSVNRTIYKISIQWGGPLDQAGVACREIVIFCTKQHGKQKDIHYEGRNLTVWDASDGNIVFDMATGKSEALLNLTFTSSDVAKFKRLSTR
jgi:hypothetical protein